MNKLILMLIFAISNFLYADKINLELWGKDGIYEGDSFTVDYPQGIWKSNDGILKYQGVFSNEKPHGKGTLFNSAEKTEMIGSWYLGSKHGEFIFKYDNGKQEKQYFCRDEAYWRYGAESGYKKIGYSDSNEIGAYYGKYIGNRYVVNSIPIGKGYINYSNGDVFKGDFNDSIYNTAMGTYYYKNGDVFIGTVDYVDQRPKGQGEIKYNNGSIFKGFFNYEGIYKGTYIYRSGDKYEGTFENNLRNGYGVITFANGNTLSGIFDKGNLIIPNEKIDMVTNIVKDIDFNVNWIIDKNEYAGGYFDIFESNDNFYAIAHNKNKELPYSTNDNINNVIIDKKTNWNKTSEGLVSVPNTYEKYILSLDLGYVDKIKLYAIYLTVLNLNITKDTIAKPKLFELPLEPTFIKGEFEPTVEFEKRTKTVIDNWKKETEIVNNKNNELLKKYDTNLKKIEEDYQNKLSSLENPEAIGKEYIKNIDKSILWVLGKPRFRDIKYNADTEMMKVTLYSTKVKEIETTVEFPVSLNIAQKYKKDMEENKIIPTIGLNKDFKITKVEVTKNTNEIAFEYAKTEKLNTVEKYNEFIKLYPDSQEAKKAKEKRDIIIQARLDKEAADKKAAEDRVIAEKKFQEEQEKAAKIKYEQELPRYKAKKQVGDRVIRYASYQSYGFLWIPYTETTTMVGTVEQVSGNRIQIKIIEDGNIGKYGENKIYKGALFWDDYDNWMK